MQKEASPERESWKGPDEARIITFNVNPDGSQVTLGGNDYGTVLLGRMRSDDGSIRMVAVKRFHTPLTDGDAQLYAAAIEDLKGAGVDTIIEGMARLPKGTLIGRQQLQAAEWAQVSAAYVSSVNKSEIVNKSDGILQTPQARMKAAVELTKVANAGHLPVVDMFEPFKDESRGILIFDIDTMVNLEKVQGKPTPPALADSLQVSIEAISSHLHAQSPERKALYDASLAAASPPIRQALKRIIPE
jgi:hypothetical protein